MKTPEEMRAEGWKRTHMCVFPRLLARGWQWEKIVSGGRVGLAIVSPSGARWVFRLQRGAWVKRI